MVRSFTAFSEHFLISPQDSTTFPASAMATTKIALSMPTKPLEQEVMKIYLKNGSYKSLLINSETKAGDVCEMMAQKIGMEKYVTDFDLMDVQKDKSKFLLFTNFVHQLTCQSTTS